MAMDARQENRRGGVNAASPKMDWFAE